MLEVGNILRQVQTQVFVAHLQEIIGGIYSAKIEPDIDHRVVHRTFLSCLGSQQNQKGLSTTTALLMSVSGRISHRFVTLFLNVDSFGNGGVRVPATVSSQQLRKRWRVGRTFHPKLIHQSHILTSVQQSGLHLCQTERFILLFTIGSAFAHQNV